MRGQRQRKNGGRERGKVGGQGRDGERGGSEGERERWMRGREEEREKKQEKEKKKKTNN